MAQKPEPVLKQCATCNAVTPHKVIHNRYWGPARDCVHLHEVQTDERFLIARPRVKRCVVPRKAAFEQRSIKR
jgi:hypothetical protein